MSQNDQAAPAAPGAASTTTPGGSGEPAGQPGEGCQFPGCGRPVPPNPGKGRPARYCGQVVLGVMHNRANAMTRRRQLERAGVDADRAVSEPVTVARSTAIDLVGRIETVVTEFAGLQAGLVQALTVMDSPEQAAAQVAAQAETARAEVGTARAEALAARRRAEQAETTARQAVADAEDAEADASAAREQAELDRRTAEDAVTARAEALAQLERTRQDLAAQVEATAQSIQRSERAEARAAQLDTDLTTNRGLLAQTRTDAATAAAAATAQAERDAAAIAGLQAELAAAGRQLVDVRAELAAQVEATGEQTHRAELAERDGERAARDLAAEQERHLATVTLLNEIREQLTQTRTDATAAAATAQAHAATAATTIAGLRDDLTQARTAADATRTALEQARTDAAVAQARAADQAEELARLRAGREARG